VAFSGLSSGNHITPSEFMAQSDEFHPNEKYGDMVIQQILSVI